MHVRKLECFIAVARDLHFGRAASRLNMNQSTLSEAIRSLEIDVDGALFTRTSRKVELTALGEHLLDEVEPAVISLNAALRGARNRARGLKEELFVGYIGGGFYGQAAPLLAEMDTVRPDIRIVLTELSYVDQVDALLDGKVDAALLRLPIGHSDLRRGAVLFEGPRVLVVPDGHRLAGIEIVDPEELQHERLLRLPAMAATKTWVDFHFPSRTPAGARIPDGATIHTVREGLAAVAAGQGVFGLTQEAQNYYLQPGVVFVPIDLPPVQSAIVIRARDRRPVLEDLERSARRVAAQAGSLLTAGPLTSPS